MAIMEGNDGKPIAFKVTGAVAANLSDTVDLTKGVTAGIYLGASGDLAVILQDGSAVTFTGLAAGVVHPLAVKRIKVTGTTAANILACY